MLVFRLNWNSGELEGSRTFKLSAQINHQMMNVSIRSSLLHNRILRGRVKQKCLPRNSLNWAKTRFYTVCLGVPVSFIFIRPRDTRRIDAAESKSRCFTSRYLVKHAAEVEQP